MTGGLPSRIRGVPTSGAWAHRALTLPREPGDGPLILVRRGEEDLEDTADALKALAQALGAPAGASGPFPFRSSSGPMGSPGEPAYFGEDAQGRLASFERLHRGAPMILAAEPALRAPAPAPEEYARGRLRLRPADSLRRADLIGRLEALGYRRADFVEGPGEYAARGAVVDFFPWEPPRPARVLFDGDSIASLRAFDPQTQELLPERLGEASVAPAVPPESGPPLAEVLAARGGLWLAEDGVELPAGVRAVSIGAEGEDFGAVPVPPESRDLGALPGCVRAWREEGLKVLLFAMNRGESERLQEMLEGRAPEGTIQFLVGPLRQGFLNRRLGLAVLSSAEIFARSYRSGRSFKPFAGRPRLRWGELKKGDYVVHELYGISRYLGLETVEVPGGDEPPAAPPPEGRPRRLGTGGPPPPRPVADCLKLEFRGGDVLYVPMTDFRSVQKYVGAEGHRPRLSSLDTRAWEQVKERVREGVRELAEELLKLQAARKVLPGHAFGSESHMEREFAESFPFEETPDQRRAIAEVLADMASPHPMDRVVVGDVGFGKTEVAMRAALRCAAGGKQAAVLVPTTILADQHLRTFRRRFAEYPVRVEMLSRFQTRSEQRRTLEDAAAGRLDVLIGTHRLLQPDVRFRDLGLLVIDEEHRFGVRAKERLKAFKRDVDCLTLSATPIPRTLHQGLSGLRSLSLIQSAPSGRQPITTTVRAYDEAHVAWAVREELARGGQVYYVHNRVRSLDDAVERLRALVPEARFAKAHGQMREGELEEVMWGFCRREHDVLVASSIIESGLDIPSVNTLLVEDAQDFGLSQLYQLRGRIGRERRRAYCYLYHPAGTDMRALSEDARKRLEALREFGHLGSGFSLALRDLEIRGAGDLLGAKQSGFLNAVGVEFYSQLLREEIARADGKAPAEGAEPPPPQIDVALPAFLPPDYLPGDIERLKAYKRLLAAKPEELDAIERELTDLSGPPPPEVRNLLRVVRLRAAAAEAGARSVVQRGSRVEVYLRKGIAVPAEAVDRWMSVHRERIEFLRSPEGDGLRVLVGDADPLSWAEDFLRGLKAARRK